MNDPDILRRLALLENQAIEQAKITTKLTSEFYMHLEAYGEDRNDRKAFMQRTDNKLNLLLSDRDKTRGGLRVLLIIFGLAGSIGGAVGWVLTHLQMLTVATDRSGQ